MPGQLSAQFGLDLQQAQESVAKTDASIKKLTQALQQLDSGFAESAEQTAPLASGLDQLSAKTEKHVGWMRQARTEHRNTAYAMRESREVVMMSVFAMMALMNSDDNASKSQKAMNKTLMETIMAFQATRFAVMGLNAVLGAGMTGGMVTAIAAVVAGGIGLVSFFRESNVAAENAAKEGLKDFADKLVGLTPAQQQTVWDKIAAQVENLEKNKSKILAAMSQNKPDATGAYTGKAAEEYTKLQNDWNNNEKQLAMWKEIQSKAEDTMLGKLHEELGITHQLLTTKKTQAELDAEAAERNQKRITDEQHKIDLMSKQVQLGELTNDDLIKEYNVLLGMKLTDDQRLMARIAIQNLSKKDVEVVQEVKRVTEDQEKINARMAREQQEYISGIMRGMAALNDGMSRLGMKTDSFLSKLIRGIELAIELSRTIGAYGQNQEGGETGSILSIIGEVASVASLFDTGGYTGSGGRYEVAGFAHRGEVIFEKPIVDRVGVNQLLALRASLQTTPSVSAGGNYSGGGLVTGGGNIDKIVNAIKAIPDRVEMTIRGRDLHSAWKNNDDFVNRYQY